MRRYLGAHGGASQLFENARKTMQTTHKMAELCARRTPNQTQIRRGDRVERLRYRRDTTAIAVANTHCSRCSTHAAFPKMSSWLFSDCPATPDFYRESLIATLALIAGALLTFVLVLAFSKDEPSATTAAKPPAPPPKSKSGAVTIKPAQAATNITPDALQSLVEARRSVQPKDYTGAAVPDAHVKAILASAPWSPNHGNTEPWRFVVYSGKKKQALLDLTLKWYEARPASFWKKEFILASTGKPEFADAAAFSAYYVKAAAAKWGKASHLIVLGVKRQEKVEGKKQHPTWEEDCAVACGVQNMHLLATSMQIGAYWSSWYAHYRASDEIVKDVLKLDPSVGDRCLGVFVVGAVNPELSVRATRKGLAEVSRWA